MRSQGIESDPQVLIIAADIVMAENASSHSVPAPLLCIKRRTANQLAIGKENLLIYQSDHGAMLLYFQEKRNAAREKPNTFSIRKTNAGLESRIRCPKQLILSLMQVIPFNYISSNLWFFHRLALFVITGINEENEKAIITDITTGWCRTTNPMMMARINFI
jgi:hypothetical protein